MNSLYTVGGTNVVLDFMECRSDLKLAFVDILCVAWFFVAACPVKVWCVLLHEMTLPIRLSGNVGWNLRG